MITTRRQSLGETPKAALVLLICTCLLFALHLAFAKAGEAAIKNSDGDRFLNNNCSKASEKEMLDILFANYSVTARPRIDAKQPVAVDISLWLFGVEDFIEKDNNLILNGYLTLHWFDEFLDWNRSLSHMCVDVIALSADTVWLPDIILLNSVTDPYTVTRYVDRAKVYLVKGGEMNYDSVGKFSVTCEVDLTYFPFDKQQCFLRFESWTQPTTTEVMKPSTKFISKVNGLWSENKLWRLVANWTESGDKVYTPSTEAYSYVMFVLQLERKALFYYANIIIPSIIISVVELVTFFLPITEVIKIHISVTCLLAYSVFQTMITEQLPRSSDNLPLLILYLDLQMAFIGGIALIGEGVVFYILEKANHNETIPLGLIRFCYILARIVQVPISQTVLAHLAIKHRSPEKSRDDPKNQQQNVAGELTNNNVPETNALSVFEFRPDSPIFFTRVTDNANLRRSSSKSDHHRRTNNNHHLWRNAEISHHYNRATTQMMPPTIISDHRTANSHSTGGNNNNSNRSPHPNHELWMFVARVTARCNFCLYLSAILITPLVLFGIVPFFAE